MMKNHVQVLGEEAETLRHTLAEIGVRISRDQVRDCGTTILLVWRREGRRFGTPIAVICFIFLVETADIGEPTEVDKLLLTCSNGARDGLSGVHILPVELLACFSVVRQLACRCKLCLPCSS